MNSSAQHKSSKPLLSKHSTKVSWHNMVMSWYSVAKDLRKPTVLTMLLFGFSAGIPILLIFSSLSLWLREAGVSRSAVTFFSWAALGYSFKFVWAPLTELLPIPFLTQRLGRRRSWILLSQGSIIGAILLMAWTDPAQSQSALTYMAVGAVLLGFSSATQDIVIDAYRIESDTKNMQALLSSSYIAGYRLGMLVAGAGALYLASAFGTDISAYNYMAWRWTYMIMAGVMLVGVLTTLFISEPPTKNKVAIYSALDYLKLFLLFTMIVAAFIATFFLSSAWVENLNQTMASLLGKGLGHFLVALGRLTLALSMSGLSAKILTTVGIVNQSMVEETYIAPVKDFFKRYGKGSAILILSIVGLYRISDIVLGVISNVFYLDMGFTKNDIATVSKTFGLCMTLLGGFLGGILTTRYNVMKILFLGALLSAATNVLFILLAHMGPNMSLLYVVISADNLSAGMANAAFIAFLSSLTSVSFTAVQYAIFSSMMTLLPKVLGGYSGSMVEVLGYEMFFATTTLMGIPVLYVINLAQKRVEVNQP